MLRSLPEGMRNTLTRPGLMHTLPNPLQNLLLPMSQNASIGRGAADVPRPAVQNGRWSGLPRRRRRQHRPMVEEAVVPVAQRDDGPEHERAEREAPLGQLVWNPLPSVTAPVMPPAVGDDAVRNDLEVVHFEQGMIDERNDSDSRDLSIIYSTDRVGDGGQLEEKIDEDQMGEGEETRTAVRRGGVGGQNGRRNFDRRHPFACSPQRAHSLPPLIESHQAIPVDVDRTSISAQPSRGASSVSLELRAMSRGTDNPGDDRRRCNTGLELQAAGLVPSAERILASIIQVGHREHNE